MRDQKPARDKSSIVGYHSAGSAKPQGTKLGYTCLPKFLHEAAAPPYPAKPLLSTAACASLTACSVAISPYTCMGSRSAHSYTCENNVILATLHNLAIWAWPFVDVKHMPLSQSSKQGLIVMY